MKTPGFNEQQFEKMKTHPGFIAALDQSGGSTPGALRLYGIKEGTWSNPRLYAAACFEGLNQWTLIKTA